MTRRFSLFDRLLSEADSALRTVAARPHARAARPDADDGSELDDAASRLSAALMRVNHSGEIAAQALYRGQALVARDDNLRRELLAAADEEHDHLAWCSERTAELGGRTSLLAPFWYAGSFTIGMTAGLAGDGFSLGFLDETEQQVSRHLDSHLERLPAADTRSRMIVARMREDELRHSDRARELGGKPLPAAVKQGMRMLSKVMTGVSFRV